MEKLSQIKPDWTKSRLIKVTIVMKPAGAKPGWQMFRVNPTESNQLAGQGQRSNGKIRQKANEIAKIKVN